MVNLSSLTYPDSTVVDYTYLSSGSRLDADLGRVTRVRINSTAIAEYDYNGVGSLVGIEYAESSLFMTRAVGTHYDALDRFGRVVTDTWTKTTASNGDKDFYDVDIAWGDGMSDDAAQIKTFDEHVHAGFDWGFEHDELSRVKKAERGTLTSGSISADTFTNDWTLDQVGNWAVFQQDVNGDGTYTSGADTDEDRTHNVANELTDRDSNIGGTDFNGLSYDGAGNLTDDLQEYEYVYDAWNRLVEVATLSVAKLERAAMEYIDARNDEAKPFAWTADADTILGRVDKNRAVISKSGH